VVRWQDGQVLDDLRPNADRVDWHHRLLGRHSLEEAVGQIKPVARDAGGGFFSFLGTQASLNATIRESSWIQE